MRRSRGNVCVKRLVAGASALAVVALSAPASSAPLTIHYAYDDARYLLPGQHDGASAYVTDGVLAKEPTPVVVFLHGINPQGAMYRWFGGAGEDLRPLAGRLVKEHAVRPFVLAGPSQTRDAGNGRRLWESFDLDRFLRDTQSALGGRATLDRSHVIVVGHSGAGCNYTGGILGIATRESSWTPLSVIALDTCLDAEMGATLGAADPRTLIWVQWQKGWHRDLDGFREAFDAFASNALQQATRIEELSVFDPMPHDAIVQIGMERALKELFPR